MLKKILSKIYNRLNKYICFRERWSQIASYSFSTKTLFPVSELAFGAFGGTECFFADIDGDNNMEVITYQGPGVFGAKAYNNLSHIKPFLPQSVSVSAFRLDGTKLWTWGEPNETEIPYISHSYEACIDIADVDGDGEIEIIVADGDRVYILDGKTGEEKKSASLPDDNFYIVKAYGKKAAKDEAAIVLKNGEQGSAAWNYGEPVIGLNEDLEPVWKPKAIIGGGHYILCENFKQNGELQFMTGYSTFNSKGELNWTVDTIDANGFDSDEMHADYIEVLTKDDGSKVISIAGSDKLYLVDKNGKTIFRVKETHPQGTCMGRYVDQTEFQVVSYNAPKGPINLYYPDGKKIWSRIPKRSWPLGEPENCKNRRFHRNRPVLTIDAGKHYIGYADGGWPWALDGKGKVALRFAPPKNSMNYANDLHCPNPQVRADDIGYGFGMQNIDIDQDGKKEVLIYNRQYLWIYKTTD
jgi:hypothetical protein